MFIKLSSNRNHYNMNKNIFRSLSFLSFLQYLKRFDFNILSEWCYPRVIPLSSSSVNQELYCICICFLSNWSSIALFPDSH